MQRVVYHNLIDVLSMVTLGSHLCGIFMQSDLASIKLPHDDLLSLARWYDGLGMVDQAEQAYQATLSTARHDFDRAITLESLAALYKRQERREDALQCWESLAKVAPSNLTARLELSKFHEWTTGDIAQAIEWTKDALRIIMAGPQTPGRESALDDLMYRMERLKRKLR
jgi:tetratricopeptide (TPR) repeat protein